MIELVLRILVTVDDKIQTAQSIIVARLLRNTENRLGERRKNRRAEDEKIYSRHRISKCGDWRAAGSGTNEPRRERSLPYCDRSRPLPLSGI
jgi:hypothetical protein